MNSMFRSSHQLAAFICLLPLIAQCAEQTRCRCVCPPLRSITQLDSILSSNNNTALKDKVVYIKKNVQPETCHCEDIVDQLLPKSIIATIPDLGAFCLKCQCHYELRNLTTQKVVIIFVIVVFTLMFIYAFFLMCLDPIMNKRRKQYAEQIDETSAEEIPADQIQHRGGANRVSQAVHRVRQQQERWKGQVSMQRTHIYTEHRILA